MMPDQLAADRALPAPVSRLALAPGDAVNRRPIPLGPPEVPAAEVRPIQLGPISSADVMFPIDEVDVSSPPVEAAAEVPLVAEAAAPSWPPPAPPARPRPIQPTLAAEAEALEA